MASEPPSKRQKLDAFRDENPDLPSPRILPSLKPGHRSGRPLNNTLLNPSILAPVSDRLTSLPHELIIRILHLLPFKCVLLCQLVSRRMRHLASDAQVWKGLYYARFVRPRVMRLKGVGRTTGNPEKSKIVGQGVDNRDGGTEWHTTEDAILKKRKSRGPREDGVENGSSGPRKKRTVEIPRFSSRESKWLDEWWLVGDGVSGVEHSQREMSSNGPKDDLGTKTRNERGRMARKGATDWKARYKLRHNWSIGAAEVKEISLYPSLDDGVEDADEDNGTVGRDARTSIARLGGGVVITVNTEQGLRAWDLKSRQCVAQGHFTDDESPGNGPAPTCLAIDSTSPRGDGIGIVVGFSNGQFEVWLFRAGGDGEKVFERQWKSSDKQGNDELSGVAYAEPHLLTMTAKQVLSIYVFDQMDASAADASFDDNRAPPRLLTSLRSHTCWPPLYLSLRSTPQSIIASIAYSLPTYLSGWSVGLQELHLSPSGTILKSRLASAIEQGFRSLLSPSPNSTPPPPLGTSSIHQGGSLDVNEVVTKRALHPTSLSYSHPYLLAGNRDNTLTSYLVTSNNEELKISKGTTLWGHTSSVSGAQVGGRGKAVSVSARGDELRVWDLEAELGRKMVGDRSVRVKRDNGEQNADILKSQEWIGTKVEKEGEDRFTDKGWVGFDDEVVIVLRNGGIDEGDEVWSEQKLVVYDFA